MSRGTYHVVRSSKEERNVKWGGSQRLSDDFSTKKEAIEAGRETGHN